MLSSYLLSDAAGAHGSPYGATSPEDLHTIRTSEGQLATARNICNLLEGSGNTTVAQQQLRPLHFYVVFRRFMVLRLYRLCQDQGWDWRSPVTDNPIITKEGHVIQVISMRTNGSAIWLLGIAISEICVVSELPWNVYHQPTEQLPSFCIKHPVKRRTKNEPRLAA